MQEKSEARVPKKEERDDLRSLVLELYKSYEPDIDRHLWPWETKRWHELAFCLLTTIGEPEVSPETIREITRVLGEWRLLDIDVLANLNPAENKENASNPVLVSIETILQQSGFDPDKSKTAVTAICEAAFGFKQNYNGKVQKYFRKYGSLMLDELDKNFSFSRLNSEDIRRAFAIWFQNTLNMPIPAVDLFADLVCKRLGKAYDALVEEADTLDINVALLDDSLRAYWENELAEEEFLPAEEEV